MANSTPRLRVYWFIPSIPNSCLLIMHRLFSILSLGKMLIVGTCDCTFPLSHPITLPPSLPPSHDNSCTASTLVGQVSRNHYALTYPPFSGASHNTYSTTFKHWTTDQLQTASNTQCYTRSQLHVLPRSYPAYWWTTTQSYTARLFWREVHVLTNVPL